jgi:arginine decarboxylase
MNKRTRRPVSPRAFNSAWQLRVDVWSSIADLIRRLADQALQPDDRAAPERELGELLGLVTPVESYWADPGTQRVSVLRELVAAGDYELASRTAEPIARSLVGDSAIGEGRDRPSFDVLVVVDNAAEEAEALAEELRELRRPEDPFTYELVFVPSFQDALVAVGLNFHLQACVIRPEFRLRSQHDLRRIDHRRARRRSRTRVLHRWSSPRRTPRRSRRRRCRC